MNPTVERLSAMQERIYAAGYGQRSMLERVESWCQDNNDRVS